MSDDVESFFSESDFEGMFADILGFTKKDWDEIEDIARHLKAAGAFKGDPLKAIIGGFILWFEEKGFLISTQDLEIH